ncbi:MAG: hypothetical protein ACI3X1_02950 [Eubacteriales bacterium]
MADDQEKLQATDVKLTSSNKFLSWLENFWFYHKWKVIVVAFFAVVLTVGIVQMVKKTDPDVDVTVATHTIYYREQTDALEKTLVGLMPADMNGDGKKTVQLNLYKIYSEDELRAANEAETDENGYPIIYADPTHNKEQISQYNSYIMTGQCSVMILSEYLYDELVNRRTDEILLKPMSEIFGDELPTGVTKDGYGIKLSETGAYKYLDGMRSLPDDSVICIMRPFVTGGNKNAEKHEMAVEYFKNIVLFGQ